jgi:hypothetical protein
MAWPRTGLVVMDDTAVLTPVSCLATPPTASCAPSGSGGGGGGGGGTGGGGTGGGGIDDILIGQTLYTNMNVNYFKINLVDTKTNMYGEAIEKWYYNPVNVRCNIERGEITNDDDEFGVTVANIIKITIPRALLQSYNFLPEVGDIVMDREKYYEINSIDTQFITVPGTGATNGSLGTTGQVVLYVLNGYLTRVTKLNIIPYYQ